jgi:hypothetical protein
VRFENKTIFFYFEKTLSPTTALCVVAVNSKVVGLTPKNTFPCDENISKVREKL